MWNSVHFQGLNRAVEAICTASTERERERERDREGEGRERGGIEMQSEVSGG